MKRFIVITVSLYLAACVSLCYILAARPQNKIKNTEANDIIFTVREYWPDVEQAVSMMQGYETDYLVTDADGRTVAASRQGLDTDYVYDFIHKDYSADILVDGKIQGRIIFINNEDIKAYTTPIAIGIATLSILSGDISSISNTIHII